MRSAKDVLKFWFEDHGYEDWFGGGEEFDKKLADAFHDTHGRVAMGEAFTWRGTPEGRVAEIIVLDQFSRQLYRGSHRAFAQDGMAIVLAQELVAAGFDRELDSQKRMFAYMPYMHSESVVVHEEAMRLFGALDDEDTLDYERRHFEVIKRFGRYPKRNAALGRASTPEEIRYIEETDAVF